MRIPTQSHRKRIQDASIQKKVEEPAHCQAIEVLTQLLSNKRGIKEFWLRFPTHTQVYKSQ